MTTINHIRKELQENGLNLVKATTKRECEIVIRQMERNISRENERKLKLERLQFERKISELKNTLLRQLKQDREKHEKEVMLMKRQFKEQMGKNRKSFLEELERLRQQLEYVKSIYTPTNYQDPLGEQKIIGNPPVNPLIDRHEEPSLKTNSQDESLGRINAIQLEELLNRLKREMLDELGKRDMKRAAHDPSPGNIHLNSSSRSVETENELRKKDAEILQLNEQVRKLQGFQSTQPGSRSSKWETDSIVKDDAKETADHDKMQKEILDLIKEITQEKKEEKLKIQEAVVVEAKQASLGSKVSKKIGLVNSLF